MKSNSRRALLLVSAALTGIGLGWVALPSFGLAPEKIDRDDFRYIPSQKNAVISFELARKNIAMLVQDEIEFSQKDFGIKYSKDQIDQIHATIWESTQLNLFRYYRPKEQPKIEN